MSKNALQRESDAYWFSRGRAALHSALVTYDSHSLEFEYVIRAMLAERFEAGARWCHVEESKLSPHIAQFLEMCILLAPTESHPTILDTAAPDWPNVDTTRRCSLCGGENGEHNDDMHAQEKRW